MVLDGDGEGDGVSVGGGGGGRIGVTYDLIRGDCRLVNRSTPAKSDRRAS
jgi:hypothetical protein